MPRLKFSDIYTRVEAISNVKDERDLIKDAIQWGLDELTSFDLPYLMSEGYITTVAPYETGTLTATNGSATLTGAGTTWTSAMVGRKIRINDETEYYRIKAYVSGTELTLETVYTGDTAASLTYSIYKDEYKLAPDVDVYKVFRQIENNVSLGSEEATAFDIYNPSPSSKGSPYLEILIGTKLDTYSTGTIAGTVAGTTLTGTTTTWASVEGLGNGSRITIGNNVYTVKSVDSNTQLTIYEKIVTTVTGATYSISLNNLVVQFKHIPDAAENIYYRYQRIPFPLVNDYDVPDLPEKYHMVLVIAGLAWVLQTSDKNEASKQLLIFGERKQQMWKRMGHISRTRTYSRRSQDVFYEQTYPVPLPSNVGIPISLWSRR